MKVLSFDVGIKNLAYCLIDTETNIISDWGIIDLYDNITKNNPESHKCQIPKRAKSCDKPACYYYKSGEKQLTVCKACDKKISAEYSLWSRHNIKGAIKTTKDIGLQQYGKAIYNSLKAKLDVWGKDINTILIENQPVLKNPTMKSIQMILYSFFIFFYDCPIVLYSARNKLAIAGIKSVKVADDSTGKKAYSQRKNESKLWVREWLSEQKESKWIEVYNSASKQDDLADCLIQVLSWTYKNTK